MSWQAGLRGCLSSVCILTFRFFCSLLWVAVFLSSFSSSNLHCCSLCSTSLSIWACVCVSVCVCVRQRERVSSSLMFLFFSCQCNGASAVSRVCCFWVALHRPRCLIGFRSLHACCRTCKHCWCTCTSLCKALEEMLFSSCGYIFV